MFPFWDLVIAPALDAVEPRRVVEIGALRGDTTTLMLERLGPDCELHVIDPVPAFDPAEHQRQFPGRYLFHRDLSVNVLPDLPPMDAALIDGDHNWYTVHNELTMIAATSRKAGEPLPLLILHDVAWPYGHRDLYYDPDTIPEEHRQPYEKAGMVKGKSRLLGRGGLNPTMFNAIEEGGPRNGVMTALDDFCAEHDRPLRRITIPIYFGLAVVVEEERLERSPALAKVLDGIEELDGQRSLLELAEDVRLQAMVTQHGVFFNAHQRYERAAKRYLDLLKGALLNEHYIENDLRIEYLQRSLKQSVEPDADPLRDPMRQMRDKARRHLAARQGGTLGDTLEGIKAYFPYTTMGRTRLDHLEASLDTVRTESVAGDLVEVGTGRGGGAVFFRGYLQAHEMAGPQVWVVDSFRATADPEDVPTEGIGFPELLADLNHVREAFSRFDLFDDRVRLVQGVVSETLPEAPIEKVALLRVGGGLDTDPGLVLDELYDRISTGGFVVIDDYLSPACREAVDAFRLRRGIQDPIEHIDWMGAAWRKTADAPALTPTERASVQPRGHAPIVRPAPTSAVDLTVVVVFYNMRREAARTLHSLSRAYQQGTEGFSYEVIAIDNGSDEDQRLGAEFVESFGPEFRYVDLGAEATSSPVPALNRGADLAAGKNIAFMIDGAHVLTPGVLRFGMLGLTTYAPSVVVTQQWYMGPGQQGDAMVDGYDQEYEDRLFEAVEWPIDGYRLFDIGHFIGERDWLDGLWESNCIFVPRKLLQQVGGYDESFSMPGGGFANLEFYERMCSTPDVAVTTMLGEGSFHQTHGGTTTNQPDINERHDRIGSYARHFQEIRGRTFQGHRKRIHYVGTMMDEAARTRPRRLVAPNYFKLSDAKLPGIPETASPIPQELKAEFTDAYWRSLAWKSTTWLGKKLQRLPTDLFAYQDVIVKVRPNWIIETRTGGGGRALFLATICDLIGHGQVLSIDAKPANNRPDHDRITYVEGDTWVPETVEQVREIVGDDPRAIVILGARAGAQAIMKEYRAYESLIPTGSYLIIEDTIVNGHPVWPNFGPGPFEAVKQIVEARGDFASDNEAEKYKLSFNPSGFLRRLPPAGQPSAG